MTRTQAAGVATLYLPLANRRDPLAREAYDRQLANVVASFRPELIVLAGWMLILTPSFLERFPGRIINVHPALLPEGDEAEISQVRDGCQRCGDRASCAMLWAGAPSYRGDGALRDGDCGRWPGHPERRGADLPG